RAVALRALLPGAQQRRGRPGGGAAAGRHLRPASAARRTAGREGRFRAGAAAGWPRALSSSAEPMASPRRGLKAVSDPAPDGASPSVSPERGLPPSVLALLGEKLDPRLIARRKGPNGHMVRYLEGYQAINQANRLFGPDNWGAELVSPVSYHELRHVEAKNGAMKRALRHFGDQFANALYERPGRRRAREAGELADLRTTVLGLGAQLGMDQAKTREAVESRAGKPLDQLDTAELARVLRAMAGALAKQPRSA